MKTAPAHNVIKYVNPKSIFDIVFFRMPENIKLSSNPMKSMSTVATPQWFRLALEFADMQSLLCMRQKEGECS